MTATASAPSVASATGWASSPNRTTQGAVGARPAPGPSLCTTHHLLERCPLAVCWRLSGEATCPSGTNRDGGRAPSKDLKRTKRCDRVTNDQLRGHEQPHVCSSASTSSRGLVDWSAWIARFLAGSEPAADAMFGVGIFDAEDDDLRWDRWRSACRRVTSESAAGLLKSEAAPPPQPAADRPT